MAFGVLYMFPESVSLYWYSPPPHESWYLTPAGFGTEECGMSVASSTRVHGSSRHFLAVL